MAGDGGHLADVIGVHDGIAVDALEGRGQDRFDRSQTLRSQKTALGGDDPDQLPFRLDGEDFIEIEQEVIAADSSHHFAGGRRGNLRPRAFDGHLQALPADGFKKVIDGSRFKRLDGVLMEGGHNDDHGEACAAEPADDLETVELRHLEVEKHEVRTQIENHAQSFRPVARFADQVYGGQEGQFFAQDLAGDGLVVDNQRFHGPIHPIRILGFGRRTEEIMMGGVENQAGG